jgi:hypothetical protein
MGAGFGMRDRLEGPAKIRVSAFLSLDYGLDKRSQNPFLGRGEQGFDVIIYRIRFLVPGNRMRYKPFDL